MAGVRTLYNLLFAFLHLFVLISGRTFGRGQLLSTKDAPEHEHAPEVGVEAEAGALESLLTKGQRLVFKRSANDDAPHDARQKNDLEVKTMLRQLNDDPQSLMALLSSNDTALSTSTTSATPSTSVAAQSTPESRSIATVLTSTSAAKTEADSPYVFNPNSGSNVAVYYGQTDHTSAHTLTSLCNDQNIDIIILAFVTKLVGPGGWPVLNLGPECWAASAAQTRAGATGLLDCVSDQFASQITHCQNAGKKVFLSLGGSPGYSDISIASEDAAFEVANTIWNLFLGGTDNSTTNPIRPFGNVVLDGIDIDNESGNNAHFEILIYILRWLFSSNNDKHPYFISAAPQCPIPDASIPLSSLQTTIDFVMPQFYNNPSCNLNSGSNFLSSVKAWSSQIAGDIDNFVNINNGVTSPRLLLGLPSFAGAGTGFVDWHTFAKLMDDVGGLSLSNLGGAMFWDGSYGEETQTTDGIGVSYMQLAKDFLTEYKRA